MVKKFNIREFLQTRPLSWSALSSFDYDPEQWFKRYILGEKQRENSRMIFGKVIAHSIEMGRPLVPFTIINGEPIKGKNVEHPFKVMFSGVPLIGFADTFDHVSFKKLGEFKTSEKGWDQTRVDQHGQITMYLLMNYITNKVNPEDVECFLEYAQTYEDSNFKIKFVKPVKIYHFKTKRTMADILRFGKYINDTIDAMQKYVESRQLSTAPTIQTSEKVLQ
jgi:hypothetical protein